MALYQGHVFIPRRLRGEDLSQLQDYQSQIDAYKDSYDTYKQQVEDYNKAIEQWNAGPRTSPFEGVSPTAPAEPGFKQEDIDAFQGEALGRATQRQSQLQTAVNVAQNPEAYGFGGFGFREGGMVPAYPSYGGGGNSGGIMSVLQPFGDYLNEQIDVQRVDPFLETVSNAAYQEFGIQPDQGGGGFFSGGFYKDGGGLPDRDLFGGGGMPHPDEGFDYSNPFPNMPQPIYERPTPDFPEGLFGGGPLPAVQNPGADNTNASSVASLSNFGPDVGGGPMSGGTPTQLPGPRIPTFTGTGNDGFGSVSQGPLDFFNPKIGEPEPDYTMSAYNFFNPDPRGLQTGLPPEEMVRRAQGRLMQQDVKPPEVGAYLQHIVETGGRPTMMAPNMMSNLAVPLMGVLPGGGMIAGQPGPGFGLPSGNGPGGVTLRPGAPPPSGFQGIETVGLGGLQLARTNFG